MRLRAQAVFLAIIFVVVLHACRGYADDAQPACDLNSHGTLTADQIAKAYAAHKAWVADTRLDIARKPSDTLEIRLDRINLTAAQLADPRRAVLCGYTFAGANLANFIWNGANLAGDTFAHSAIAGATFIAAELPGARFIGSDLRNLPKTVAALYPPTEFDPKFERWSRFDRANLRGAHFEYEALVHATFTNADLHDAAFFHSDTSYMKFLGTDLTNARFDQSDLSHTVFEPNPDQLPNLASLVTARNLSELTYNSDPAALLALRQALRNAGYEPQARMITHAIRARERALAWQGNALGKISGALQYVCFELPSAWGLAPWRPLLILLVGIPVFAIPYFVALRSRSPDAGIWRAWRADRLRRDRGTDTPERLRLGGAAALRQALRFSLRRAFAPLRFLCACSHEYALAATGWVRCLAGAQSILSIYLILLWALCTFAHPFG